MRWFSAIIGALLAASAALVGCGSTGDPPADPDILAAMAPVCARQAVSGAGSVGTTGQPLNHIVVLDKTGAAFEWTEWVPNEWRPASTADTELVACVDGEPTRDVIEVCPYTGSDITRYEVSRDVAVIEPSSGRSVAFFAVTAQPRTCSPTENAWITELEGTIDEELVIAHLASLVERGVFVDPDAPGSSSAPTVTSQPTTSADRVELRDAISRGLVSATGTGDGLSRLDLELTSEVDRALSVDIEPGTLLDPGARQTQTMVVVGEASMDLEPLESASISLDVACSQMHQDQPDGDDLFTVRSNPADADLLKLLEYRGLTDETFRIKQFAIWTITNNPRRNDYVPLGTAFEVFGTGPSDEELDSIRILFEAAELDVSDYRALR